MKRADQRSSITVMVLGDGTSLQHMYSYDGTAYSKRYPFSLGSLCDLLGSDELFDGHRLWTLTLASASTILCLFLLFFCLFFFSSFPFSFPPEGVGKSSLISTFVSRYFSEVVPGMMTRVRLPPDPHSACITTIVDSQGADAALLSAVANVAAMSVRGGGGGAGGPAGGNSNNTNSSGNPSASGSGAHVGAASTDSFSSFMHRAEGGGGASSSAAAGSS